MLNKNILYISYDGLTDPLGQSQILPYLVGLARMGYHIHILSFEKPEQKSQTDAVSQLLQNSGICWHALPYTRRPPIVSTLFDILRAKRLIQQITKKQAFDIVHCRSYIAALIGMWMKKKTGAKFIFDMRGFWADERVDGVLWNLRNPLYKWIYAYFKKKEIELLLSADSIVSLTQAGADTIRHTLIPGISHAPVIVIPCCADVDHFRPEKYSKIDKDHTREQLGFSSDDKILVYLGSLGTWYLAEEMLRFFHVLHSKHPEWKFLIITREPELLVQDACTKIGIPYESIVVTPATRNQVPQYLSVCSLSVFFIRQAFSKLASSPVKQAECLAMGIPCVFNSGIGDSDTLAAQSAACMALPTLNEDAYKAVIPDILQMTSLSPESIRNEAITRFSLSSGIKLYHSVYESL